VDEKEQQKELLNFKDAQRSAEENMATFRTFPKPIYF